MHALVCLGVLNGVTVMGAGDTPAAVVAITGRVKNINVMQSALAGKQANKRAIVEISHFLSSKQQ